MLFHVTKNINDRIRIKTSSNVLPNVCVLLDFEEDFFSPLNHIRGYVAFFLSFFLLWNLVFLNLDAMFHNTSPIEFGFQLFLGPPFSKKKLKD